MARLRPRQATGGGRHRGWPRVVSLAVVGCVLAACGSSSASPQAQAQAQTFLNAVHGAAPGIGAYRSDVELTRLGRAVCDDLRSGASYEQVADRLSATSGADQLPTEDLGAVITSAVSTYCPNLQNRIS